LGVGNSSLKVAVRVADGNDLPEIARLRALWTGVEDDAAFRDRLAAWSAGEGDRRTMWLALVAGQAVGMASVLEYRRMPRPRRQDSCWGYVSNMFVREEFRNQGVGSAVLSTIIAAAEERGYARLVLSPSERAVGFYQRAGFLVPDESAGGDRLLVRPRAL
jgi:GNAT superfamily N-acetyltransferase